MKKRLRDWFRKDYWWATLDSFCESFYWQWRQIYDPFGTKLRQALNSRVRRKPVYPALETLETRNLMATLVWDGGGIDSYWNTLGNWDDNAATPATGDTLIFDGSSDDNSLLTYSISLAGLIVEDDYDGILTLQDDLTVTGAAYFDAITTVVVASGTLTLQGGGVATGTIQIDDPGNLAFAGSTYLLDDDSNVWGDGEVDVTGAGVTVEGDYSVTLTKVTGGEIDFDLGSDVEIEDLDLWGGTVGGSGEVTVTHRFDWSAGYVAGTGTLASLGTMTIREDTTKYWFNDYTIRNEGTGTITGTGVLSLHGDTNHWQTDQATLENPGELRINGAVTFSVPQTGQGFTLANTGYLTVTLANDTDTVTLGARAVLNNDGTVTVATGTLSLGGGGTAGASATGTFQVNVDGTLEFASGYLLDDLSEVTDDGRVHVVAGGSVQVEAC